MKHIAISIVVSLFILLAACGQLEGDALLFKTADPRVNIGVRLLSPPPLPESTPAVLPEATATAILVPTVTPTPEPTACRTIAGNISSQGKKLWHDESSPQWSQIRIDESKGEMWFCSPEEAEAAGWTRAGN